MTIMINDQKAIFLAGLNLLLLKKILLENGRMARIAIEKTRASTPPNLFGIDRRIAYANKKYHSGWIWTGVTRGFAAIKFSGSPKSQGTRNEMARKNSMNIINPIRSIILK